MTRKSLTSAQRPFGSSGAQIAWCPTREVALKTAFEILQS